MQPHRSPKLQWIIILKLTAGEWGFSFCLYYPYDWHYPFIGIKVVIVLILAVNCFSPIYKLLTSPEPQSWALLTSLTHNWQELPKMSGAYWVQKVSFDSKHSLEEAFALVAAVGPPYAKGHYLLVNWCSCYPRPCWDWGTATSGFKERASSPHVDSLIPKADL